MFQEPQRVRNVKTMLSVECFPGAENKCSRFCVPFGLWIRFVIKVNTNLNIIWCKHKAESIERGFMRVFSVSDVVNNETNEFKAYNFGL